MVHFKPQVEVASSNPFESVFAIYKPDFEVVRIFTNLWRNFRDGGQPHLEGVGKFAFLGGGEKLVQNLLTSTFF